MMIKSVPGRDDDVIVSILAVQGDITLFNIQAQPYGFELIFGGMICEQEINQWIEQSNQILASVSGEFGIVIDIRTLTPLAKPVQEIMEAGFKLYKSKGMQRSAVIVDDVVTQMKLKRQGQETGVYQWERYISSNDEDDWKSVAVAWVNKEVDPDRQTYKKSA